MIICVLLCYPLSIHMSQLLSTGRPISSFFLVCTAFGYTNNDVNLGCTTKLGALIGYRIVVYASSALHSRWVR